MTNVRLKTNLNIPSHNYSCEICCTTGWDEDELFDINSVPLTSPGGHCWACADCVAHWRSVKMEETRAKPFATLAPYDLSNELHTLSESKAADRTHLEKTYPCGWCGCGFESDDILHSPSAYSDLPSGHKDFLCGDCFNIQMEREHNIPEAMEPVFTLAEILEEANG